MPDRSVLWTAAGGVPQKLDEIRYCDSISPLLQALIPPRHSGNIQRKLQLLQFEQRGIELRGRPLGEQDWLSLVHFGRGGIGALDVFPDDRAATEYYSGPQLQHGLADLPALLRFARNRATQEDMNRLLAVPVAGVAGMQPKVVLDNWIVKFETSSFPGLLQLEELAYRVHQRAGCEVPEARLAAIDGQQVLISRRFDRGAAGAISLESVFSILATRDPTRIQCNTDGSAEDVLGLLRGLNNEPQREAYRRFLLSFLTGNGDLHLENIAVLGSGNEARLSPVFDPAPMRAYRGRPNYDLLSALPFCDVGGVQPAIEYREYAESGKTPPDLKARVLKLGEAAGLSRQLANAELDKCLVATDGYVDEAVYALRQALPPGYAGRVPDIAGFELTLREIRAALE